MGSRAETRTWVGQRKAETPVRADTEMPSSRFTWTRPTTHIYSYNREAQNIISSRSARATSVAANESRSAMTSTSESTMRSSRAASVAATSDNFSGYSGYWTPACPNHAEAGSHSCCSRCANQGVTTCGISCSYYLPQQSDCKCMWKRQRFLVNVGCALHCCLDQGDHHY